MKSILWRNIHVFVFLILILNAITSLAQHTKMGHTMEQLKSKQKQELIVIALHILKEKQPSLVINFENFESTVWGNSKEILVKFRRIIRYVPFGIDPEKRFSYDITVNLNTNEVSPFDDWFQSEFYIETKVDQKALAFIKKNFGSFSANFENTIYEGEEDYFIDSNNQYSFGKYKVNKRTGIVKTEIQGSYEPMPKPIIENPDDYSEIK
ncbi:hypothetical protein [Flavobacterium polysaccharolyticum]|uniref:Uncharacterized protein n=1 Tax=Flavobacterium polysaccharolyticum TaxID=3133148 RepID=A0ABU9NKM3_9FLAO